MSTEKLRPKESSQNGQTKYEFGRPSYHFDPHFSQKDSLQNIADYRHWLFLSSIHLLERQPVAILIIDGRKFVGDLD